MDSAEGQSAVGNDATQTDQDILFLAFKVLLILQNATGQAQGQYTLKNSGDLRLYPGTFEKDPSGPTEMQCINVEQDEWLGDPAG